MATSALQRLKKAAMLKPIRRTVTLSDGSEFEFYASVLTMAERERAEQMDGGERTSGFGLNLLITKAKDANGRPLFSAGQADELREDCDDADLQKIILALIENPREVSARGIKSSQGAAEAGSDPDPDAARSL